MGGRGPAAHASALPALLLTLALPVGALAVLAVVVAGTAGLDDGRYVAEGFVFAFILVFVIAFPGLQGLRRFWRRDTPDADGAPIAHEAEADLARLVAEACDALGFAAPVRVHIAVDHEIRISGRRGDRILVVGAPLAATLSREALRVGVSHAALRARRLDRWLDGWATSVVETVAGWAGLPVVHAPWRWLTTRIRPALAAARRRRVLLADAQCARTFGGDAAAAWIRACAREEAFAAYWTQDVVPVLDAGFRPPVLDGWRQFRSREWVAENIATTMAHDLHAVPGPDDPRPSLGMRLAAIEAATGAAAGHAGGERFAFHTPPTQLEGAALRETHQAEGRLLVELGWERVGEIVWLPRLRAEAEAHASALAGVTASGLRQLAATATTEPGVLGAALAVALVDAGWQLDAEPGLPLCARCGDRAVLVMNVEEVLRSSNDTEWEHFLAAAGLEQISLARRPTPKSAPPDIAQRDTFTPAATLLLPRTRRRRRMTALLLAAAAPTYALTLCGFVVVLLKPQTNAVVLLLAAPPLIAIQIAWVYFRARIAFTSGALAISSEGLRIEDRGLLKRPLVVARSQIRAVVIDDQDTRNVAGIPLRFPFGPSQWLHPSSPELGATGWLWTGAHEGSVPMLGAGDETPNLLLIFDDPISAPRLRHEAAALPRAGDKLSGLALCVEDPVAAEKGFAGWGCTRSLSEEEAQSVAARRRCRGSDEGA